MSRPLSQVVTQNSREAIVGKSTHILMSLLFILGILNRAQAADVYSTAGSLSGIQKDQVPVPPQLDTRYEGGQPYTVCSEHLQSDVQACMIEGPKNISAAAGSAMTYKSGGSALTAAQNAGTANFWTGSTNGDVGKVCGATYNDCSQTCDEARQKGEKIMADLNKEFQNINQEIAALEKVTPPQPAALQALHGQLQEVVNKLDAHTHNIKEVMKTRDEECKKLASLANQAYGQAVVAANDYSKDLHIEGVIKGQGAGGESLGSAAQEAEPTSSDGGRKGFGTAEEPVHGAGEHGGEHERQSFADHAASMAGIEAEARGADSAAEKLSGKLGKFQKLAKIPGASLATSAYEAVAGHDVGTQAHGALNVGWIAADEAIASGRLVLTEGGVGSAVSSYASQAGAAVVDRVGATAVGEGISVAAGRVGATVVGRGLAAVAVGAGEIASAPVVITGVVAHAAGTAIYNNVQNNPGFIDFTDKLFSGQYFAPLADPKMSSMMYGM